MSPAEIRLWLELRKEPGGHYFRREHPAGPYRLDFYCAKAKLCVEVDGEAHGLVTGQRGTSGGMRGLKREGSGRCGFPQVR